MPARVAGLCTHRLQPQHTGTTGSKGRDRGSPRAGVLLHRHARCGSRYRSGRASRPRARCPQAPAPSAGARVATAAAVRSGTQKQPPTLPRVPALSSHQPPASQPCPSALLPVLGRHPRGTRARVRQRVLLVSPLGAGGAASWSYGHAVGRAGPRAVRCWSETV